MFTALGAGAKPWERERSRLKTRQQAGKQEGGTPAGMQQGTAAYADRIGEGWRGIRV